VAGEVVECETDHDEEDREHGEAHELDGLAAEGVDGGDGYPVAGNGTGADEDQISDGVVVEDLIHVLLTTGVTDCGQDDGVVETETWGALLARDYIKRSERMGRDVTYHSKRHPRRTMNRLYRGGPFHISIGSSGTRIPSWMLWELQVRLTVGEW